MKSSNIESFKCIPMREFLTNYLDMDVMLPAMTLDKLSKATHRDIKELGIPYVKAVPYETVTDEQILSGSIILVADGKSTLKNKRVAPYIRPQLLMDEEMNKMELEEGRGLI